MNKPTHFAPDVAYSEKRDRIVSHLFKICGCAKIWYRVHKEIVQAVYKLTARNQPPPVAEREPVNHK